MAGQKGNTMDKIIDLLIKWKICVEVEDEQADKERGEQ